MMNPWCGMPPVLEHAWVWLQGPDAAILSGCALQAIRVQAHGVAHARRLPLRPGAFRMQGANRARRKEA
jgi:hypothetical protein